MEVQRQAQVQPKIECKIAQTVHETEPKTIFKPTGPPWTDKLVYSQIVHHGLYHGAQVTCFLMLVRAVFYCTGGQGNELGDDPTLVTVWRWKVMAVVVVRHWKKH